MMETVLLPNQQTSSELAKLEERLNFGTQKRYREIPVQVERKLLDKVHGETPAYVLYAVRWGERIFDLGWGVCIESGEYLTVYAMRRGTDGMLEAEEELFRKPGAYLPSKDGTYPFNHFPHVRLDVLEGNIIRVSWNNGEGKTGPSYDFDLDSEAKKWRI